MARAAVVAFSDCHIGSKVGLSAPEFTDDDGRASLFSAPQRWLWECWRDSWECVRAYRAQVDTLYVVANGDVVDGPGHHSTPQSISHYPTDEYRHALDILTPVAALADHFFMVRGTPSHTGGEGSPVEEALAAALEAERDPTTGRYAWPMLPLEVEGVLIHFAHHGRVGRTLHTKAHSANKAAAEHFFNALRLGRRPADLLVRSHEHRFTDSGRTYRTRLVQTPAWQLGTHFINRIAPDENDIADIGSLLLWCADGNYQMEWIGEGRYVPRAATPWRSPHDQTPTGREPEPDSGRAPGGGTRRHARAARARGRLYRARAGRIDRHRALASQ